MENTSSSLIVLPPAALARGIEPAAWNAIKEIYDGASDEKVALVLDYCRARGMDPLKKPVHIVSTWSAKRNAMVETIWPSIGELRITAHRTGLFAGQDETRFGPTLKQKLGSMEIEFPEWAQVTVYRMMVKGDFSSRVPIPGPRVYFVEAYATRKRDDPTPNAMWAKRTWGQLEKAAEAAALRRAFPEENGNVPTAEEMVGRHLDEGGGGAEIEVPTRVVEGGGASIAQPISGPAADTPAPAPKRAAVPRKARGAAAVPATTPVPPAVTPAPEGPTVEAEVVGSESSAAPAPADPAKLVEPPKAAAVETPVPESAGAGAPPATPAPAPESAPTTPAPKSDADSEWPRVVIGYLEEVREAAVKNNPKYDRVTIGRLGGGTTVVNGVEVPLSQLGRVIFDPERPELNKFKAVDTSERVEWTIEQQPAASDPTRMNLIIVKASVADVAM